MDMVILRPRVKGWDCGLSGERLIGYHGIKQKIACFVFLRIRARALRSSSGMFQVTQARRHSNSRRAPLLVVDR